MKLVKERGVSVMQACRDLDVHENVLRKWIRQMAQDPQQAFPGHGVMKPEQAEIERLRKEVAKLRMERDILKKAAVGSTGRYNGSDLMAFSRGIRCQELVARACLRSRRKSYGIDGRTANH